MQHPPSSSSPLCCLKCQSLKSSSKNIDHLSSCDICWSYLLNNSNINNLNISHIFTLLRTWNDNIKQYFGNLILLALEKGANVNDYDLLSGMNLLMFACKFGASKLQNEYKAARIVDILIEKGANISAVCLWCNMNCLHIISFFDCPVVCQQLLQYPETQSIINSPCPIFHNGSALHIACLFLSVKIVKMLLMAEADKTKLDDVNPSKIRRILLNYENVELCQLDNHHSFISQDQCLTSPSPSPPVNVTTTLTNNFNIGDRVSIRNGRDTMDVGIIRYFGSVQFGSGLWYGIELSQPNGKHDGSVGGVRYFGCDPNKGTFVHQSSLRKVDNQLISSSMSISPVRERRFRPINFPTVDTLNVRSKVDSGLRRQTSDEKEEFQVNDRIRLTKNRTGTIRYIGETSLGPGTWYGIELDQANGLHDGCLFDDVRYFTCRPNHAIIRYIGSTSFADGVWIGIEYCFEAIGKNNGSVNGKTYFSCKPNYGLFVRPNKLTSTKQKQ
ncbi:unnamed protein product [Didymodactylos carnosus]|uniref:CAP-Gly domain-containing protein n=1 Tax=Didymodactylos carnosus TaxID=1234261 RepID=A0A8S2H3C6_9BILA|nr:unnamed protein product [Didymodactylos carnosus]CAF3596185.1 unnamed protein product [Didymodactylos carnosus]